MEVVISQNARAISEFYPHDFFHEGVIFEICFEKKKIICFEQNGRVHAPALRVLAREPG